MPEWGMIASLLRVRNLSRPAKKSSQGQLLSDTPTMQCQPSRIDTHQSHAPNIFQGNHALKSVLGLLHSFFLALLDWQSMLRLLKLVDLIDLKYVSIASLSSSTSEVNGTRGSGESEMSSNQDLQNSLGFGCLLVDLIVLRQLRDKLIQIDVAIAIGVQLLES